MTAHDSLWVVLADGEPARILVPVEAGRYRTANSFDSTAAHTRSADIGSAAPGRSFESATTARHAITPRTDPHVEAKHEFVTWLANWVTEAAASGKFDRLVLVAPAHALHDFRAALGDAAASRIVGTLQRDLVKTPDQAMTEHLTYDVLHAGA